MAAPAVELPTAVMAELQRAQQLRQQSQALGQRLAELRLELFEHDRVIAVLKETQGDRTCYRLVGDVLVERKVGDVLPDLEATRAQLASTIESGSAQRATLEQEALKLMQPHAGVLEELGRQDMLQQQA